MTSINAESRIYDNLHVPSNTVTISRAETTIISKQLRAEGYYAHSLQQLQPHHYQIATGPRFSIAAITITSSTAVAVNWPSLQVQQGGALRAADVLRSQQQLLQFLQQHCYPETTVSYKAILNTEAHQADLFFTLKPGPQMHISALSFSGLESINAEYLRNHTGLTDGQCLRTRDLDQARLKLLQTGLLTNVHYSVDGNPSDNTETDKNNIDKNDTATNAAAINFHVTERSHRSIKAAVGYTRDAEAGANLGWENRNLWGDGEQLLLETGFDQISESARSTLTLPDYRQPDQQLQFAATLNNETPDAYTSRQLELSSALARDWNDTLHTSIGLTLTRSRVEENEETDSFQLLSLPMSVNLDYSDNKIDPREGWSASLSVQPFVDINQDDLQFLQTVFSLRSYFTNTDWMWQPTLALKASMGMLTGAALENIPADQRFYVGGGGSVRGYAYQSVGELTDNEADGGKSFADTSIELRLRVFDNWELVTFTDGGYAYADNLPQFGSDFLWSAGLGVRYHTRFAPLRFDVAFPLNKRDGIDDALQIYISFGQSF